jgi:hypothetical protein
MSQKSLPQVLRPCFWIDDCRTELIDLDLDDDTHGALSTRIDRYPNIPAIDIALICTRYAFPVTSP